MSTKVAPKQIAMEFKSSAFLHAIDSNSIEQGRLDFQLGAAIGMAAARANLNHKQLCAHMDLDTGAWSRQLQGEGQLSLTRLLKCPPEFWHEFLPLLAGHFGLSVVGGNGLGQSIARLLYVAADVVSRLDAHAADQKVG